MLRRSAVSLYTGAVYDPLSGRVEHGRSTIGTEGRSGREERWGARKMAWNSEKNTEYS